MSDQVKSVQLPESKWRLLLELVEEARTELFQQGEELRDLSGIPTEVREELLERAQFLRQTDLEEGEEVAPFELPDMLAYLLHEDIDNQLRNARGQT